MPTLPPITLAYILRIQNQQCWDYMKIICIQKKSGDFLVCTSHTHIRRQKCGDLGLKPGGVMWGLQEISTLKRICIHVTYTYTYQTTKMWGLGLETWGCNVGTIGNIYFEKNLYSDTNQTHYLGPHIAPLTNTNICWGLYYTRLQEIQEHFTSPIEPECLIQQ